MSRQQQIVEIVKRAAKQDSAPDIEESLFDSGYLDSFAFTDMVGELETKFGFSVPDSDLTPRKFETVAKIESYVEQHTR